MFNYLKYKFINYFILQKKNAYSFLCFLWLTKPD